MSEFRPDYTPENVERVLSVADEIVEKINDQNTRHTLVEEEFSDEPEIVALATEGITEEQQESVLELTEFQRDRGDVWEHLGLQSIRNYNAKRSAQQDITESKQLLAQQEQEVEAKRAEYEAQELERTQDIITKIQKLSPRASDSVRKLLESRLAAHLDSSELSELETEQLELLERIDILESRASAAQRDEDELEALLELHEMAWPIPKLVEIDEGDGSVLRFTLDELPVDPKLNKNQREAYSALREHHIDQPEAALYSALYLTEHAGKTVSAEDLGLFLYGGDDGVRRIGEDVVRGRVTTILGPQCGVAVKKILGKEEHILQYGWRRSFEVKQNGETKSSGPRRRIYRAIKLEDIASINLESEEYTNGNHDAFVVDAYLQQAKADRHQQLVEAAITAVPLSSNVEHPTDSQPTVVVDSREVTNLIEVDITTPELESSVEIQRPARSSRATKKSAAEHATDWRAALSTSVGEVINELEPTGLLDSIDGISVSTARLLSNGGTFATRTALDRMSRAGLYPRTPSGQEYKDAILTPTHMVIMKLFNSNRAIFGGKNKDEAMRIVEECVTSYFRHREEREQ